MPIRATKPLPPLTDCRREALGVYVCGHPQEDHDASSCGANDADTSVDVAESIVVCACTGYVA